MSIKEETQTDLIYRLEAELRHAIIDDEDQDVIDDLRARLEDARLNRTVSKIDDELDANKRL